MMLVTVFGNKLNKWRFIFFLGWGKTYSYWMIIPTEFKSCMQQRYSVIYDFYIIWCLVYDYDFVWYIVRDLMKAVIKLLPLLGITWIIGILAVNEDTQVFAWIFAILNSLQVTYFMMHPYCSYTVCKLKHIHTALAYL